MDESRLAEKLDILIKLTAASVIKEDKTQTESILKLSGMGIKYRDIATIMGASEGYVALVLSRNKSKKKEKVQSEEAAEPNGALENGDEKNAGQ